jgi:cation diffusion facilitator CzcD-associated flavoprotein CzcO
VILSVIETDYLIVGAGASGMAFADALIAECDADVVMVERRHCPGGHWNDAYPFVRIHRAPGLGFVLHSGKEGHAVATDTAAEFFNCHEKACKTLP